MRKPGILKVVKRTSDCIELMILNRSMVDGAHAESSLKNISNEWRIVQNKFDVEAKDLKLKIYINLLKAKSGRKEKYGLTQICAPSLSSAR